MSSFILYFLGFFCITWQFSLSSANSDYIIVETNLGKIRGAVKELNDGKKVNQFFGIPYAKPPVGELRWKETVPVESWNDVLDASKLYPPHCPQIKMPLPEETKFRFDVPGPMSEDCLHLSIWAPSYATPQSKLSVLVAIHGGGFIAGTALNGDGTYVATLTDVIVVSVNYRLGFLGFAPFPASDSIGNYGMFDQVTALKWVKDHIVNFGGNPDSITIYGCSAGGASVSLLTLSPLSKGLFRRAVSQSGTATAFWSASDSSTDDYTFLEEFGSHLNCSGSMEELQKCLQDKTVDEILQGQKKTQMKYMLRLIPHVDGKFLPEHPLKMLESGKVHDVDQMIGVCKDEGDGVVYIMNMTSQPLSTVVSMFAANEPQAVQDAIIHEYSLHGEESSPNEVIHKTADFINDRMFGAPADATARLVSKAGKNVYFYVFAHRNKHSVYPDWVRVSHGEEVGYTVGTPLNISSQTFYTSEDYTEMEKGLSLAVMKMWSNFAKTGDPSSPENGVQWPQFTVEDPAYLEITLQPEVKRRRLKPKAMAFWNEFIPKLKEHLKAQETQPTEDKEAEVKDEL